MNIQVSSNFERMLYDNLKLDNQEEKLAELMSIFAKTGSLKVDGKILKNIQNTFDSYSADDETTKKVISEILEETNEVLDPHTAIGVHAAKEFKKTKDYKGEAVITMATAHPAKFPDALIDAGAPEPKLPHFLQDLHKQEEKFEVIENDLEVVKEFISKRV